MNPVHLPYMCLAYRFVSVVATLASMSLFCLAAEQLPQVRQPNIVIMLADDLGYGSVSCLNPDRGKIHTPNLDAIASSGLTFTDAHSNSSVCSPTRYGLLTGRYAWRTRLQEDVLTGGPSLIAPQRMTLAKLLRPRGYDSCVIGKWHLNMLFDGRTMAEERVVPIGAKVTSGPIDAGGFDEFHGYHHARQMQTWIDNDTVTANPEPVEMLPRLTAQAISYITSRHGKDKPFLLYIPWSSPHGPIVPAPEWKGRSGLSEYADFVLQTDDSIGQVIQALKDHGLYDNTIIISTSDNGTARVSAGMDELEQLGHYSSGYLRGAKSDLWDGGHRVPFFVSWPGHIQPGSRSNSLVSLTDVFATIADITGATYPQDQGEDSVSQLALLLGKPGYPRSNLISHSIWGYFSLRQGKWKLICCPGSGGWTEPTTAHAAKEGLPLIQLYDMTADLGEQRNLAEQEPEIVNRLRALLEKQIADGRSTPGPKLANDIDRIIIDKPPQTSHRLTQ